MKDISSFLIGLLFGTGLAVSGMTNPDKVIAFLNVSGDWDPSLALVMLSAVIVSFLGYRLSMRRTGPLLDTTFRLPDRKDIDARLLIGAGIFGVGWGLVGYCPGPVVTSLASLGWEPLVFFVAMALGMLVTEYVDRTLVQSLARPQP